MPVQILFQQPVLAGAIAATLVVLVFLMQFRWLRLYKLVRSSIQSDAVDAELSKETTTREKVVGIVFWAWLFGFVGGGAAALGADEPALAEAILGAVMIPFLFLTFNYLDVFWQLQYLRSHPDQLQGRLVMAEGYWHAAQFSALKSTMLLVAMLCAVTGSAFVAGGVVGLLVQLLRARESRQKYDMRRLKQS